MPQIPIGFPNLIIIIIHVEFPVIGITLEYKTYPFCIPYQVNRLCLMTFSCKVYIDNLTIPKRFQLFIDDKRLFAFQLQS